MPEHTFFCYNVSVFLIYWKGFFMIQTPITNQKVQLLETIVSSSEQIQDYFVPFAVDESILHHLVQFPSETFLHFWEMEDTVILGMTDTKTPYLEEGVALLKQRSYTPVVRHAGGLAVVSNSGVLNISLLFSRQNATITQVYEWMQKLITRAFPEAIGEKEIQAFEVSDSYCPGDYDLSIQGKKFAGIAQRRFKNSICVSIYLSINGNQEDRGNLIHDFYEESIKGEETRWHYPDVNADSMANLSQLLDLTLTVQEVKERILTALLDGQCELLESEINFATEASYQKAMDRLNLRKV